MDYENLITQFFSQPNHRKQAVKTHRLYLKFSNSPIVKERKKFLKEFYKLPIEVWYKTISVGVCSHPFWEYDAEEFSKELDEV